MRTALWRSVVSTMHTTRQKLNELRRSLSGCQQVLHGGHTLNLRRGSRPVGGGVGDCVTDRFIYRRALSIGYWGGGAVWGLFSRSQILLSGSATTNTSGAVVTLLHFSPAPAARPHTRVFGFIDAMAMLARLEAG